MDQSLLFLNSYLIPGLITGAIYALGAIGVTLIYGVLRFAHFAHGDMMTLGAFLAVAVIGLLGLHPMIALPIAMALVAFVSLLVDRAFYQPLRSKPSVVLLISSFGAALVVRSLVQIVFGVDARSLETGISYPIELAGGVLISERHMWIVGSALVLMSALHLLLTRTRLGKAMRAVSDSPELARLTGISLVTIVRATWVIGGSLAAAAGVFAGWDGFVQPTLGWDLLLPVFAAAILGGLGSPYGALVGGMVIGLAEEFASFPWLESGALLSPGYKTGVAFAIMIAMLIWRPSGLFGTRN